MLENFFQLGSIPADHLIGSYDSRLVILSYMVASFASYIALDITGRLHDVNNTKLITSLWLIGGAFAMGAGIWSMHFIGMLAFKLPMPMAYDPMWTAISMVVAIGASGFALFLLKGTINRLKFILGGIVLGLAIAAMHYTGMHAMQIDMTIHYLPGLFFLSILIAIVASEAAIWLALQSTIVVSTLRFRLKFISAFIMGAAICGMHYTGMASAIFTMNHSAMAHMSSEVLIDPEVLAVSVAIVTFFILGIAIVASIYKESLNQQLLLTARQAGMAEVAASVLHNVGNVLNSINVSSILLTEKIKQSKLSSLTELNELITKHKNNLNEFITKDPRGSHLPDFIHSIADCWEREQKEIANELQTLSRNIEHVRSIIATQQDLSRLAEFQQVISTANVIEEALLISGIEDLKHAINLTKNYQHLKPVLVDKVKFLQILVNLIQNAKDAVLYSQNLEDRSVAIKTYSQNGRFYVQVSDNGEGIPSANLTRIFAYGFTTKKKGHGFGLHTSAILAKDMGGSLQVKSAGKNQGATFTLELPYKNQ